MNRKIARNYFFSDHEVNNIIMAALRARDIPGPGNAGTAKWTKEPKGIRVEWTDEDDDVEL